MESMNEENNRKRGHMCMQRDYDMCVNWGDYGTQVCVNRGEGVFHFEE